MKRVSLMNLLVAALFLPGCGTKTPESPEPKHADTVAPAITLSAEAQRIAGIEVIPASARLMQESLTVPGVIASMTRNRAVVTPPVAGRLIRLNVQLGDRVRQGQSLAVIESSDLAQSWQALAEAQRARDAAIAELNQAKSEANLASAKLQAAQITLVRQRDLAKAGAFSQAPLQQAQTELNDAQSSLLEAQRQLEFHSQQFQRNERLFKEGLVSKADLEAARLDVQLDENRVANGKSRVEIAKSTFEREKSISQKGLLNAREVQVAESEARASKLERDKSNISVQSAKAAVANSERAIRNAQATYHTLSGGAGGSGGQVAIVAPVSGTITRLDITRGQAVERTQSLMEVEDLSSVWATASVQEKDIGKVSVGANCSVTAPSMQGRNFNGVVQVVASRLDPKTRTMPVQCLITGSNGALKPDMYVTVRIGLSGSRSVLAVALSAVVTDGDKHSVYVKEAGKFVRREVTLGISGGDFIEVLKGLKGGELVAVKGSFVLTSESKKGELRGDD